jgi:site-specific DNA recombinase
MLNRYNQQVQRLLRHPEKARVSKRDYSFRGLLTCQKCGCAMTPDMKKGRYLYYRCTEYKGKCKNSISEPILVSKLEDVIKQINITPEIAEELRETLHESNQDKVKFHEEAITALEREYRETRNRLNKAYEDRINGLITESFWRERPTNWNAEMIRIEGDIASHRSANTNYVELGNQIIALAQNAHAQFISQENEEKRKLLNYLVTKIEYSDGKLHPTYRKPFNILVNFSNSEIKRGRRDSNPRPHA